MFSNDKSNSYKKNNHLDIINEDEEYKKKIKNELRVNLNTQLSKKVFISDLRYKYRFTIHKLVKIVMDNIKQTIFTMSRNLNNQKLNKYNMK